MLKTILTMTLALVAFGAFAGEDNNPLHPAYFVKRSAQPPSTPPGSIKLLDDRAPQYPARPTRVA